MKPLHIHEILKYIPHRYPFLLIDRVIEVHEGKSLVALKNVSINEPFFVGHFPEMPIMPGVLILEALAQAGGILANLTHKTKHVDDGEMYFFAGIDKARFKRIVEPGDQLRLEVNFDWSKQGIWGFNGSASVEGKIVCSAELMIAKRKIET